MMSNTKHEQDSNIDIVQNANGDVLIAGLGLGMITIPICQKMVLVCLEVVDITDYLI